MRARLSGRAGVGDPRVTHRGIRGHPRTHTSPQEAGPTRDYSGVPARYIGTGTGIGPVTVCQGLGGAM